MVHSPKAGRGEPEAVRAALAATFEQVRLSWQVFEPAGGAAAPGSIRDAVERALGEGCALVVAAGGDGTVSMTADALVHASKGTPGTVLGIVPLGTANILARELGVPLDMPTACFLLVGNHRLVEIDAMELNGQHYFTQIGVGPDALMIEETSREAQRKLGRLAYMIALVRRAFGHRAQTFHITVDGRHVRLRGWEVVVANAKTLGAPPFVWGPQVNPSDGRIDLCVYNVRGPRDYLRVLWTLFARRHLLDPNARFFRVQKAATVSCRNPLPVQADGESVGETPIEVRLVPRAVRVIAPAVEPGMEPRRQHLERIALRQRFDQRVATIGHADAAVFLWINRLPRTKWMDTVMTEVSASMPHGEGWLVAIGIAMLTDLRTGWHAFLEVVPAMWLTSLTVNYPIKALFRRRRPFLKHEDAIVIGTRPTDHSFPSGHSAAAFAGALLLSFEYPSWSPLFYIVALLVGFSRVYLGVHFPLDVAIGAVVGMVLAAVYSALLHLIFPGLGG